MELVPILADLLSIVASGFGVYFGLKGLRGSEKPSEKGRSEDDANGKPKDD